MVYFLSTTWISIAFLVLMAWQLDAWQALPVALIVMIANSIYIVALTAFLMGLRPNKAIFDASIMVWFWIGTVIPLLGLFLLSFTQGDTSFYQNWYDQVREGGLNATSAVLEDDLISTGFTGILAISGAIIIGGLILLRLLDKRWGKAPSRIEGCTCRFEWWRSQGCRAPGKGRWRRCSPHGIPILSMGDMVREEVRRRGLAEAPHVFGEVAADLRASHGEEVLAVRLCDAVDRALEAAPLVIIEGMRGTAEHAIFSARWNDRFGSLGVLAGLSSDSNASFDAADPRTATGRPSRFVMRERGWGLEALLDTATWTLRNEGDLDHLTELTARWAASRLGDLGPSPQGRTDA